MSSSGKFGVFSLLSADISAGDPGVDNHGRALRQRRFHAKSRQGCITCKSRRVKCDEQRPTCLKCSRRGLRCEFDNWTREKVGSAARDHDDQDISSSESNRSSSGGSQNRLSNILSRRSPSQTRELGVPGFSFESLQLMYHFEHFTFNTLTFDESFWKKHIFPMALQHEYLMHAIMTISASHLLYLQPKVHCHKKTAAMHLDKALSGFRASLSGLSLPQTQYDVVIACGFILLYYAWSVPFFNASDEDSTIIESDGLLWFAAGIKTVIVTIYKISPKDSIFQAYLETEPVKSFYAWSEQTEFSYDFGQKFLSQSQAAITHPDVACVRGCGSVNAAERLGPVFHALDATRQGEDLSVIMPSIMIYMLMWPSKAMQDFQDEVKEGKHRALITLLSFYASSWMLLSGRAWWAYHRSKIMCEEILSRLDAKGHGLWDQNILNITEYFGLKLEREVGGSEARRH